MSDSASPVPKAGARLVVKMLGPPVITWEGHPLAISRRQVRALLYRLAVDLQPVSRDVLCALFWPDVPTDVAHTNLSRLIYLLKHAVPDPSILRRQEEYLFLDPHRVWSDTYALGTILSQPDFDEEALSAAAALYRGDFLEGFFLPHAPEFELWLMKERYTWEQRYLSLLTRLMEAAEQRGDYGAAIRWASRYLEIDEATESVHRRLIQLYGATGNREAAAAQFERCVVALERELGVDPLPETRAAYEAAMRGERSAPASAPALPPWHLRVAVDAPFVGREAALQRLQTAYANARGGQGAVVFIGGEAGIGKTRLLQEFTALLPPNTLVLTLTGQKATRDLPYAALVRGIRRLLPAVEWSSLPVSPTRLATLVALLPELVRLYPDLQALSPSSGQQQVEVFEALNELLGALASTSPPLVFCVDDFHHLDESTRSWLEYWLAFAPSQPILFLLTYRPEEEPGIVPLQETAVHRNLLIESISLTGLERAAVSAIVNHVLGTRVPETALDERLHRLTGGNPFFLLEILRSLAEQKERICAPTELTLPLTVRQAVHRRLRQLPVAALRVLEAASVLGTRFSLEALTQTSGYTEDEVVGAIEVLTARGLIREQEAEYAFAHELVQELVYRHMLHGRRCLLHRRAARALQRLAPHEMAAIARHLQMGEEPGEAAMWWVRAGDAARKVYAYEEAIRCYERALALYRTLGDEKASARTLMRLGLTHHTAFDFRRAAQAYAEGFNAWTSPSGVVGEGVTTFQTLRVDWPHLDTLDPARALNSNAGGVIEHLFSGLVEWDPDLNVVPDAARKWEVLDEGRRYVFYLKEDFTWSDGRPVHAQDFVAAWRRVLCPRNPSSFVRLLFPIRHAVAYYRGELSDPNALGVRAADELTLVVELEHPCGFFLHVLAHPVTRPIPLHRVLLKGQQWWQPDELVTNGPFRLRLWEPDRRVVLARSPTYRGSWEGNVEEVVLYLGLGQAHKEKKWRLYQQNKLDVFALRWGLTPAEMDRLRREYANEFRTVPNFFVRFLGFNARRPPFDDPRVRHAFARALDRHTVVHLMGGDLEVATGGIIPPGMPGQTDRLSPPYAPREARALLEAAGYPNGHHFPEVTLLVFPGAEAVGEYMQLAWKRVLGVPVSLEVLPWEVYMQRVQAGPWPDLFLFGWVADYPDPDSLLRVCTVEELTGWHNELYTSLLEQAAQSQDVEERWHLYQKADTFLMQELPILPLAYSRWSLLIKPWVRHFPISPLKWWFWKHVVVA